VLGHFDVDLPAPVDAEAKAGNEGASVVYGVGSRWSSTSGATSEPPLLSWISRGWCASGGAQHSGIGGEIADAFRELELPYPPANPADAWVSIRAVTLRAVDVLREEIQAADRSVS